MSRAYLHPNLGNSISVILVQFLVIISTIQLCVVVWVLCFVWARNHAIIRLVEYTTFDQISTYFLRGSCLAVVCQYS